MMQPIVNLSSPILPSTYTNWLASHRPAVGASKRTMVSVHNLISRSHITKSVTSIAARYQISAGLLNTRSSAYGGLRMFASYPNHTVVPMPSLSPVGTPSVALHVFVHFNCHVQHGMAIR